jgi:hypothetical protein
MRRRAVLKDVVVVFSGGLLSDAQYMQCCAFWRLAEALGASCEVWMDVACVTHVVSQQADTGSVRAALGHASRQIHAVKPTWLLDCATRWYRQSEALYAWTLPGLGGAAAGEGACGSLEVSSGLGSSSSGSGCRVGAGSAAGPLPLSGEETREEMCAVASMLPSTLPKKEKERVGRRRIRKPPTQPSQPLQQQQWHGPSPPPLSHEEMLESDAFCASYFGIRDLHRGRRQRGNGDGTKKRGKRTHAGGAGDGGAGGGGGEVCFGDSESE